MQEVSLWDLLFWQGITFLSPRVSVGRAQVTADAIGGTSPNREEKEFPGPPKLDHVPFDNISCPFKGPEVLGGRGGRESQCHLLLTSLWSGGEAVHGLIRCCC